VAAAAAAGIAENKKLAKGPGSRAPATCSFQCRGGMRRVCLKGERYRSTFFFPLAQPQGTLLLFGVWPSDARLKVFSTV
jgi:hypothetical protein